MNDLKSEGWYVDSYKFQEAVEEEIEGKSKNDLIKLLLDLDIKEYGEGIVTEKTASGKVLKGPLVLQLAKWQNVSYPKISDHTENSGICSSNLTDGSKTAKGMSIEPITKLDGNTPYGTKVLLFGEISIENGILQLSNRNTKVLGGRVEKQVEKWKSEKLGNKENRGSAANAAPRWIPFEKRNTVSRNRNEDNFKSIQNNVNQKEENTEDSEFDTARKMEIENLRKMRQSTNLPQAQLKKDLLPERNLEFRKQERPDTGSNFNQRTNDHNDRGRGRGRGSGNHGGPRESRGRGRGHSSRDNDDTNQYAPPKATFSLFEAAVSSGMPPGLESRFSQMNINNPERHESHHEHRGRGRGRGARGGNPNRNQNFHQHHDSHQNQGSDGPRTFYSRGRGRGRGRGSRGGN